MAESIREVVVTIEVDTNKNTYKKRLTWSSDETYEEFEHRVVEALGELTELS